jgi:class 3 adenylate cyclase
VAVLRGGLEAWLHGGGALAETRPPERAPEIPWKEFSPEAHVARAPAAQQAAESLFLPRLAGQTFLEGHELPTKQEMVPLFVDMVGSTRLVFEKSPEEVLALMQAFMEVVIDIGAYHCGDVHDFEGDGALLYFAGAGEAVPAAFRLREELARRRERMPGLPPPRLSLDVGLLVIGVVGTRFRQTVSLVGPAVHTAARILKLAPPGGIAATSAIVERARRENPELAARFAPLDVDRRRLDAELETLRIFVA